MGRESSLRHDMVKEYSQRWLGYRTSWDKKHSQATVATRQPKLVWYQQAHIRRNQLDLKGTTEVSQCLQNMESRKRKTSWARSMGHEIELEQNKSKVLSCVQLTEIENQALKEFVKKTYRKGYIRHHSISRIPVLFIPKRMKNSGCVSTTGVEQHHA